MAIVRLRAGHVQPVWAGHPWVFAQAIAEVEGAPAAGEAVTVMDARGHLLGRGYWSPKSAIPVRILTRRADDPLDAASLGRRIETAAAWRRELLDLPSEETTGYRLVHAEGDHLAGLIVDVYGKTASVQFLTLGMKLREAEIIGEIARITRVDTIVEVAGGRMQKLEGIEARTAVVRGPDITSFKLSERGFSFEVELDVAQKTGFYFDQRDNREMVERLAKDRRVLDAFSYTGAFSLAAARGGASHVTALDSSASAIAVGARSAAHHGYGDRISFMRADVKRALPEMAQSEERFDMVIVDPPKLVPTARHLEQGRAAYRRLNAAALRLVERGGLLVSCSCSAAMRVDDLLKTIGIAAREAGVEATLVHLGQQAGDHPVPPSFPEGRYLKCAVLRVE